MSRGLSGLVGRLEQVGMVVAGVCVTAIMLIICVDAGGRYLLNRPLPWAFDVVSNYLLVVAGWLAVSATFTHGDHISINLLHARLSRRQRAGADFVTGVLAALLFAGVGYASALHAIEAWRNNEFYPGFVMWPSWLSYVPIPIGAALIVLRLVLHAVALARHGEDPDVAGASDEGAE